MKAQLKLEYFNQGADRELAQWATRFEMEAPGRGRRFVNPTTSGKPWVAEITGPDPTYKLARSFLEANWQYKNANSKRSRGVELHFVIESGKLYEVKARVSWGQTAHYFCTATEEGDIRIVKKEELEEWLSALSAPMS